MSVRGRWRPDPIGQFETSDTSRRIGDNHDELSIFRATLSDDQRKVCERFGAEDTPPEASQKVGISLASLECAASRGSTIAGKRHMRLVHLWWRVLN